MLNRLALLVAFNACLYAINTPAQDAPRRTIPAVTGSRTVGGRFQLFQGSYFAFSNRELQQDAVFMIDTETGKTWVFVEIWNEDKTASHMGWVALTEVQIAPPPVRLKPAPRIP